MNKKNKIINKENINFDVRLYFTVRFLKLQQLYFFKLLKLI